MSRTHVKLLFAALIFWQILQGAISAKFGEPYPALLMPGFGGTLTDRDGNIRFGNVKCKVVFQDDSAGWVSTSDLLSEVSSAHRSAILKQMFSPPPSAPELWPPHSLKARLFPGRALSRVRNAQKTLDSETKEWLQMRIEALCSSKRPRVVTFIWYEEVFNVNRASPGIIEDSSRIREVQFE